jgi:hypothetical protein
MAGQGSWARGKRSSTGEDEEDDEADESLLDKCCRGMGDNVGEGVRRKGLSQSRFSDFLVNFFKNEIELINDSYTIILVSSS